MHINITSPYQFSRYMAEFHRDYYSFDGYGAIMEYEEQIGEDWELDPVAICGEFNEYGHYCVLSFRDLAMDYGSYALCGGWTDSQWASLPDDEKEKELDDLVSQLEAWTWVQRLPNGNILMAAF